MKADEFDKAHQQFEADSKTRAVRVHVSCPQLISLLVDLKYPLLGKNLPNFGFAGSIGGLDFYVCETPGPHFVGMLR